jgi:hypothetical protein
MDTDSPVLNMDLALRIAAPLCIVLLFSSTFSAQITSRYTGLSEKVCRELKVSDDEGASYEGECPGVAGYKLRLLEGDLRQSIDVVTPAKKTHRLEFWNISGAFSYVGDKAEWRMRGKTPIALIVRFNASEDPENAEKKTSYLIVAKITRREICVTDVLKPSPSQNAEARKAADQAASRPCRRADPS